MGEFVISSQLYVAPHILWDHAVSPAGVNHEMRPLLRMTFPANITDVTACWRPRKRLYRSWILLGGVLPLDYDDVSFYEVEPGRRFLESSHMFSQRRWEHERTIEPAEHGSCLTDRVRYEPRVKVLASVYGYVVKAVFKLRHRNLRRLFGGTSERTPTS